MTMNLDDFAAKVAEAKAMMKGLGGEANVALNVKGLADATAKIGALKTAMSDLNGTVKVNTDGLGSLTAKTNGPALRLDVIS